MSSNIIGKFNFKEEVWPILNTLNRYRIIIDYNSYEYNLTNECRGFFNWSQCQSRAPLQNMTVSCPSFTPAPIRIKTITPFCRSWFHASYS